MTPTSLVTAQNSADAPADTESLVSPSIHRKGAVEDVAEGSSWGYRLSMAGKRAMDFAIAGGLLLVTLPLFLVTAIAIKLTSRGPVFYVQERVGKSGRAFRFIKFRTMRHDSNDQAHRDCARDFIQASKDTPPPAQIPLQGLLAHDLLRRNGNGNGSNGHGNGNGKQHANDNGGNGNGRVYKMTADPRVTSVGRFLRRTSLDELPQIFNVLRGEMSMVGPRPPVPYEVEHYQEWHKRRLTAKPGITGLWQVNGRSSVPFDEMVLLDIYYIEHRSTALDLWIMARTLPAMVRGDGAY